ncbi:hypothetical protein [Nitrosomonas communis]|uniref:hypothetical protein n=1 Tax=Nitrosomonas communis TaxID=44574 RepID=UPI0026F260B9|nr:hypothetical protein [Nitrosomonas communis]MCO6428120.1 hypothetical protein [Nitrosomonas communis]
MIVNTAFWNLGYLDWQFIGNLIDQATVDLLYMDDDVEEWIVISCHFDLMT